MSDNPTKLLIVAGARPNFMKVAPLIHALERHNGARTSQRPPLDRQLTYRLIHTGQHFDEKMSDIFFRELDIPFPDLNLEVGSGSHAAQTANIMLRFEPVCERERPDWVVVVGDVNSTMACTLVAAKMGIRVAHIEAGLRSFDRTMPEETNRIVTDSLADLLLTPSEDASENLRREGIPDGKIRLVGNIMIDSLVTHLDKASERGTLEKLGLKDKGYIYVTLHRPSNVDAKDSLQRIVQELSATARRWPVVFPVHPRTRNRLAEFDLSFTNGNGSGLNLMEPLGYLDSLELTRHARCVLTDSGGLQEESTYFRTPCLTLRPNTERPVTVTIGSNRLTSVSRLRPDLENALQGPERLGQTPPLWDGRTAERIVQTLLEA
ncbi:MAG: UDP-N-acetylglucosamine 2-epimerase (non-hydrolyzing) [Verrucomicrobia bacterium]|nr:UDP-N-acetylglucosamine 2-epimerase (non-hydrolyzing) [Verrucomicrobiota bacterium]